MEQEWRIHREAVPYVDGQRRWDLAYQCLLRWATTTRREILPVQTQQEARDESSDLCPSVDPKTGADPDH
jgi:hypothetical protein